MNNKLLYFALAVLALPACVNETEMLDEADGVPQMTICASIPDEPLAKAGFTVPDGGVGLHVAWKAGDNIRVISGANSAVYNIQDGFTDHVASFTGPAVAGDYFDIIAPGSYKSVSEAEAGNLTLTQNGNGSTAHLVFTAKLGHVAKADLPNITFSDSWSSEHAGTTFNRGGIVKFALTLPAAVKAPKKVVMTGIGNKEIAVNLTGVDLTSEHVLTAYAQSGWDDISIPAWTGFTVGVLDGDGNYYSATKNVGNAAKTLKAGSQNIFTIKDGFSKQLFAGGKGTIDSPYLIANAEQLDNIHEEGVLKHQERVYFRLIDDIDMADYLADHTWIPINWKTPYDYIVNFDGGNHTIDNFTCTFDKATATVGGAEEGALGPDRPYDKPAFFGVLYGECYDLRFTNAVIDNSYSTPTGILAGYCGYTAKKATVWNVHVQGSVTFKRGTGVANVQTSCVGGFCGRVDHAFIDSCSSDCDVWSNVNYTGGFFGIDWADASTIRNCYSTGSVRGDQRAGGIAGGLIRYDTKIINCYSTCSVDASRNVGGIVGFANLDQGTGNDTLMPDNVIQGCIAWQPSLQTRTYEGATSTNDYYSSGAIVGFTATHNYLVNCKRRSDMNFRDYSDEQALYDQADANPTTPLVLNNPNTNVYKHYYPYHGKSFSGTLSQAAKAIGWDETVWDLSGPTPVLTGAVEVLPPEEVPSSGDPNVPAGSSISRDFPEDGACDGKWTVTEIEDGITYYHYYGICDLSWMDSGSRWQEVYVLDYDLSNTDYEVKLVYTNPSATCSDVFEKTEAIAAINAGYERGSIALKANGFWDGESDDYYLYPNGYPVSYIPNNYITDNESRQIYNWKSEGTVYFDGKQGVRIAFDGFLSGTAANHGKDCKVKTVQEERAFYLSCTDDEPAFVSSSPILIANYVQFGRTFKDRHSNVTASSEEPKAHQSQVCPRTAVALAYPPSGGEHLLLIVCDGRYPESKKRGYGMSALWLTRFIAEYFGPKYMLNLDGGGSSTMCVQDQGDMDTHVVNYPVDNYSDGGKVNHAGQRARDSYIVIVPAE